MARTQAIDLEKRREFIMRTAADLYAARGFLGTSVGEIAKISNISKSLLYYYYPSKEDILFDVVNSHVEALIKVTTVVLAEPLPADSKIRRLAVRLMEAYVEAQSHQKVLFNELVNLPEPRRKLIVDHQRWLIDAVERLVADIRPELAKDHARCRAITMLFFGMLNWTHTWYDTAGKVKPDAFATMAADSFLAGVVALGRNDPDDGQTISPA